MFVIHETFLTTYLFFEVFRFEGLIYLIKLLTYLRNSDDEDIDDNVMITYSFV